MSYLLGIDAGTTVVKAGLFGKEEGCIGSTAVNCDISTTPDGLAEIEMEKYWQAFQKCILKISRKTGIDVKRIKAVAISSQGVTFVPVHQSGRELGKAIVYYDTRAKDEADELLNRFGAKEIFEVTGQPAISALYQAPKLLWIRKHEPDRFRKTYKFLLVEDYLIYKLTGKFICEKSLISSSMLFDINQRKWWVDMLDYLKISSEKLPEIQNPADPIGNVTKKASLETGLFTTTLVIAGAIDQICGMVGVGHIHPGLISESTGSVLAIHSISNRPFSSRETGILSFYNVIPETYALMGVCPTAGAALNWFKENFCEKEEEYATKERKNVFVLLTKKTEKIAPGSDGLISLPHLAGAGSPKVDHQAKGVFYGFKLHHRKEHFIRSLMESIAYMLKGNIEIFEKIGLQINEIRSFGGGSQSKLWNQIKADVCQLPLVISSYSEPGCLGAAILAGVGSGVFKNIEEGCDRLVLLEEPQYPNKKSSERYSICYEEYVKLNRIMTPMFESSEKIRSKII